MNTKGDTFSLFRVHSEEGKNELEKNAFVQHTLQFDHNDNYQHVIMDEGLYGYHMLASCKINPNLPTFEVKTLDELPFNYELFHNYLNSGITIDDKVYPYGVCLLNKFAGLKTIQLDSSTGLQYLSKIIHSLSIDDYDYHYKLCELNRKLNWLVATHPTKTLTLPVDESLEILEKYQNDQILNNLPKNPYIGAHLYQAKLNEVFENIDQESNLSCLLKAKNKTAQFARSALAIGYVADSCNIVNSIAINANLMGGLNEDDFFLSSLGSRKGLTDKINLTPASGFQLKDHYKFH